MRIYGIKLPENVHFIHVDEYDSCDEECQNINPESISAACHLYTGYSGEQYIGFELSLGIPENEMRSLLGDHCEEYNVLGV